jgi:hypothetical protein
VSQEIERPEIEATGIPAPFVERPVGDIAAASSLARRAGAEWSLPPPAPMRVGMNALFRCGDVVVRVGHATADPVGALVLAANLTALGVRVPQPARPDAVHDPVSGLSATAWRAVSSTGAPIDWREVGRMVRRLHDSDDGVVPGIYPVSSPVAFPWWRFDELLAEVADDIPRSARDGVRAAIDRHRGWTIFDDAVVCHGDVHPGNVLMDADGPVLADWDLLCRAPRGWDHAPMMTWAERWGGTPGQYERFAEGYGRSYRADVDARAFAELRLVAATLMRVRAGRHDPQAADEARRRLRYWSGDPDAPMWSAQ